MANRILALDVGGTFVKHALFERGALVPESLGQFPVDEKGEKEAILGALCAYLNGARADTVCVSIPGPMDYSTGTSRMRHKFTGLFGVNMREYFEARCPGARFMFVHDGVAYLAGVMFLGETSGARAPAGVMLGTGLGFAFAERGRILINDACTPCFPLWNAPFRDGVAEDYVSGRALRSGYTELTGAHADVKQISLNARAGDEAALGVFRRAGEALGEMLDDRARRLGIDLVILGGQISKSADLILPYARAGVEIRPTAHPDDAALYGAYALAAGEGALCARASEFALPYGRLTETLHIESSLVSAVLAPDNAGVAELDARAQSDIVTRALENPINSPRLRELARSKQRVLVITSDHTRPVPSRVTMPLLLSEIRAGNPNAEIVILIATGMHRPSTEAELRDKLGDDIYENEVIENHDSRDDAHMTHMGTLPSGGALILNSRVNWADLILAEGFIEPHFFAGFSGGRKSILPGIASEATVRYNHNAGFIHDLRARAGKLDGNPIHADMRFAARRAGLSFILNVLIDERKRVISAVAGDFEAAHARGADMCLKRTGVERREADVVVTSNGGYPLDQNVYQAVKGMTAAEACVREGGCIVMVSRCADGAGGESFLDMLSRAESPQSLIRGALSVRPEDTPADQWEAQILARVLTRARVYFVTDEENREIVERMHMIYSSSVDEAVRRALRDTKGSTVTVIPDGVGVIVHT